MGQMTEFGAVEYKTRKTFHGELVKSTPDPLNPAISLPTPRLHGFEMMKVMSDFEVWIKQFPPRYIFVSDNNGYDFQWINDAFFRTLGRNPFGHSSRRIGDFYAGLCGDFFTPSKWKRYRRTPHDHNPVHDALGNVEAFEFITHLPEGWKKD
jgi:hypothetical protein